MPDRSTIAVIGGTGALGGALAARWAAAGYPVIVGSRSAERAASAAAGIAPADGGPRACGPRACGMFNPEAAAAADVVVVAVPFANHAETLAGIAAAVRGKVVVDATAPLTPPRVAIVQLPEEGSAGVRAQRRLGPETHVVSAFQNVAAGKLRGDGPIDCDVLVCGDNAEARETVVDLAAAIGLRGVHAGPIANAVAAEALTSILIGINKRYKVDGAGIRITGLVGD